MSEVNFPVEPDRATPGWPPPWVQPAWPPAAPNPFEEILRQIPDATDLEDSGRAEKPTNPKDSIGCSKAPLGFVSMPAMFEAGLAMLHGACKYGGHNYRAVGVRASIYFDALLRHSAQWWEGEENDPESGLPHLAHAMACLLILRDAARMGKLNDDRPPRHDAWMAELNQKAAEIVAMYPEPKARFTECGSSM